MAHRLVATSQTMAGGLTEARHGFETARALYDPQRDTGLRARTGAEPLVAIKCYLSLAELALGFPDRARSLADEAWDSIQASGQVNATAYAMWHRAILAACAGEARAKSLAVDAAAYTGQRGLQFWEAMSHVFVAWGSFAAGDPAEAANALPGLIESAEAIGGGLFGALSRSVLAEAHAAAGNMLAFDSIAESEALARRSGALYGLAEIQRREGVILRQLRPDDVAGAEAAFRRALATAREQDARFWELRAACDLARLMVDQGRRAEALDLLEPLYGWFTEGFGTTVLVEARIQLDGLHQRDGAAPSNNAL
jgi:predicted ATPase